MEPLHDTSEVRPQKLARTLCIVVLTLYVLFLHATLAQGQATAPVPIDTDWAMLIAQETDALSGTPSDDLAALDLENMSKRDWKLLRRERLEGIRSERTTLLLKFYERRCFIGGRKSQKAAGLL
jgi:hypothetical protein